LGGAIILANFDYKLALGKRSWYRKEYVINTVQKENLGLSYYFSESPWHLTIGGQHGTKSAELYNWKTGAQCFIEPLPQVNLLILIWF